MYTIFNLFWNQGHALSSSAWLQVWFINFIVKKWKENKCKEENKGIFKTVQFREGMLIKTFQKNSTVCSEQDGWH